MTMDQLEQLFMWCSIMNIALLTFTFVVILLFKERILSIHSKFFKIPEESISIAIYYFFGFWKLLAFILFVIPWVCLHIIK